MNTLPIPTPATRCRFVGPAILTVFLAALTNASAQTFTIGTIRNSLADYGDDSLALVNGNPAISFHIGSSPARGLKFVRAADAVGSAWGASVSVVSPGISDSTMGAANSLAVVNGNPAISYVDPNDDRLKFVRATDASGAGWGAPVDADSSNQAGEFATTSLRIVNGFPAISYWDLHDKVLMFVRATNASGTAWGTPVQIGGTGVRVVATSLVIVGGSIPAIGYCDLDSPTNAPAGDTMLKFVRANDVNGSAWGTPLPLDNLGFNGPDRIAMKVVKGRPGIVYGEVKFVRATDPLGTTWGPPQTVVAGGHPSLAIINGNPAIGYVGGSSLPKYVRATDPRGTAWSAPLTVNSITTARLPSLVALANGSPAISYDSQSPSHRLLWAGGSLIPEINVEEPAGTGTNLTAGGEGVTFAATARGASSSPRTFTITNFGHATLTLSNPVVTGGNAGDWTVNNTGIALSLAAGLSTTFAVTFSPTAGGDRTTTLRITSNDPDESPFDIPLYGTGLVPDIAVEQPAGTNLNAGAGSVAFSAVVGVPSAFKTFTIINTGAATLNLSNPTLIGGSAGDFDTNAVGIDLSLTAGQQTTFAVRFLGNVAGHRTTTLRIASNDPDESPFDITITGDGLTFSQDTDGDGLSDAAELDLAALGFDWQVGQLALVDSLYDNAGAADLYNAAQVKTLRIDPLLVGRNPANGLIKLTIGLRKSTGLAAPNDFQPLPFTPPGTTITAQGKLQFEFSVPDDTAFFRVEAR